LAFGVNHLTVSNQLLPGTQEIDMFCIRRGEDIERRTVIDLLG
jgi:hypothetical protein